VILTMIGLAILVWRRRHSIEPKPAGGKVNGGWVGR
jgi:hypothetical protein